MRPQFAAWISAAAAVLACAGACAQGSLEIIPLRHRTLDQVLPVLRPLLEPGGVLTGQSNQLIVRASPRNLEEIRAALAAIDTPPRRLLISVRFDYAAQYGERGIEARGTLRPGRSRAELRVEDARAEDEEHVDQRVQVLEGGRALIASGESRPLGAGTLGAQDLITGFAVVPRVAGGNVILEIEPQREVPGDLPGSARSQRVSSRVSARLGEWVELGGAVSAGARDGRRRVWVKIEEIGP